MGDHDQDELILKSMLELSPDYIYTEDGLNQAAVFWRAA